jgi:hypothetical protein
MRAHYVCPRDFPCVISETELCSAEEIDRRRTGPERGFIVLDPRRWMALELCWWLGQDVVSGGSKLLLPTRRELSWLIAAEFFF